MSLESSGKFYASVLYDDGKVEPELINIINADNVIGLDMGLAHFLTDSNAEKVENPRYLQRAQANLRRKQKKLSRKVKGSKNRNKARKQVGKAHEKVRLQRSDFLHKISRHVADESQAVAVESLQITNMKKNHHLAKSIGYAAWGTFFNLLSYKLRREGKHFAKMDPFYPSSKTCNHCGHQLDALSLSTRAWTCPVCATAHDRDHNAALNIKKQAILQLKAEGLSVSAR